MDPCEGRESARNEKYVASTKNSFSHFKISLKGNSWFKAKIITVYCGISNIVEFLILVKCVTEDKRRVNERIQTKNRKKLVKMKVVFLKDE